MPMQTWRIGEVEIKRVLEHESPFVAPSILYPALTPGGVLIIDDYGHWEGCRKAVDDYFGAHDIKILLNRVDYTGRIALKPA